MRRQNVDIGGDGRTPGLVFSPTAHQVAPGQTQATGIIILDTQNGASVGVSTTLNATAVNGSVSNRATKCLRG
jgi:hypothetical protein